MSLPLVEQLTLQPPSSSPISANTQQQVSPPSSSPRLAGAGQPVPNNPDVVVHPASDTSEEHGSQLEPAQTSDNFDGIPVKNIQPRAELREHHLERPPPDHPRRQVLVTGPHPTTTRAVALDERPPPHAGLILVLPARARHFCWTVLQPIEQQRGQSPLADQSGIPYVVSLSHRRGQLMPIEWRNVQGSTLTALYNFYPSNDRYLPFRAGDRVRIMGVAAGGLQLFGERSGRRGLIPIIRRDVVELTLSYNPVGGRRLAHIHRSIEISPLWGMV